MTQVQIFHENGTYKLQTAINEFLDKQRNQIVNPLDTVIDIKYQVMEDRNWHYAMVIYTTKTN